MAEPRTPERAPEAAKDLSKLMEQSVSTLQEVDKRLQMVRTDLANLIARAATLQGPGGPAPPQQPAFGLPPAFFPPPGPAPGLPGAMMMGPAYGGAFPPPAVGPFPGQAPGAQPSAQPSRATMPALPRIPSVDLLDEGEGFVVHVELPGVKKEDLELTVSDRMVQVRAEARPEGAGNGQVVLLSERAPVSYDRIIPFPAEVATNKCRANFKDGILSLSVPKKQPGEGPRKVDVAYG